MKLPCVSIVLVEGSVGVSMLALPTPLINSWPNWVADAAPLRSMLRTSVSMLPRPTSSGVA